MSSEEENFNKSSRKVNLDLTKVKIEKDENFANELESQYKPSAPSHLSCSPSPPLTRGQNKKSHVSQKMENFDEQDVDKDDIRVPAKEIILKNKFNLSYTEKLYALSVMH